MLSIFNSLFTSKKKSAHIKPVVLLSLDGWGIAPDSHGNAIARAKTPHIDSIMHEYPHTQLIASGESVGLPANEVGNSEVGHLTMGAGRVIFQSLTRISKSIQDGSFFANPAFVEALAHTKQYTTRLHIMGLVGSGNVHASLTHLYGLIELCQRYSITNVAFHLFTDGRDSPPQEALSIVQEIESRLQNYGVGRIASLIGRYYAMDRDGRWQRTQKAYEMLVEGKGTQFHSATEAIAAAYKNSLTDEFIEASVILDVQGQAASIGENDAVIFSNYRTDRAKQLTMALAQPDFERIKNLEIQRDFEHGKTKKTLLTGPTFTRNKKLNQLFMVTMTEYQKDLPVHVAFPLHKVVESCAEVIAAHGLAQLHMAESEKETMVTYYFDGLRETRFPHEDVIIIPSQRVPMYDRKPEMSVKRIIETFKKELQKDRYHFFMMNFANPDMVAHTGNLEATVCALEHTDRAVGEVVNSVLERGGAVFITADHGNAEELLTYPNTTFFFTTAEGRMNTDHSNNPVPLYCVANQFKNNPRDLPKGVLADIAPTVLSYMGLPVPTVMTGKNLLSLK